MSKAKELREERAKVAHEIRSLADAAEGRDFTAAEQETWDRLNRDYDKAGAEIEKCDRLDEINAAENTVPHGTTGRDDRQPERAEKRDPEKVAEDRAAALQGWMLSQMGGDIDKRHVEAAERVGLNLNARELRLDLARDYISVRNEHRALSALQPSAGGMFVDDQLVKSLEVAMLEFGGPRRVASVMRTASGEDLHYPTVDDTSNKGVLLNESAAVSEQDVTLGEIVLRAYKYSSKLVKVPFELIQDSAFDVARFLGERLGERLGRIQAEHFTTGDGAAKPSGLVTDSVAGKTTAASGAIAADEIIDLLHSVDPAYRSGGKVAWMMHDSILAVVRKLKDGVGQYLWQPGYQAGEPDRLLGYPVIPNQDMASALATTNITMLFGDFSKYMIRDVGSIRLKRLVERYADNDQEGFVAFARADGALLDAGTNPVKHLVQV